MRKPFSTFAVYHCATQAQGKMRDGEQMNFRLRKGVTKEDFKKLLTNKQPHIANQTALFQGVIAAVQKASKDGRLIEWPIELVLKPKR